MRTFLVLARYKQPLHSFPLHACAVVQQCSLHCDACKETIHLNKPQPGHFNVTMFDLLDSFNFCGGDAAPTTPQKSFPASETDPEMAGVNYSTEPHAKSFTPTVDPMNANNYLVVQLTRPMGILFEENLDYQLTIGNYSATILLGML